MTRILKKIKNKIVHYHFYPFTFLERVKLLSAASAAVPPLSARGGRTPAAGVPFRAAYPAWLRHHDRFRPGSRAGDHAVDPPPTAGGWAICRQVSLGLDDAGDIVVGGSCQMDGVISAPHTHPSRAGFGCQLFPSSKGRDRVESIEGYAGLLPFCGLCCGVGGGGGGVV